MLVFIIPYKYLEYSIYLQEQMELTAEQKLAQQQQQKSQYPWVNDPEIFDKWKQFPGHGCRLETTKIKSVNLKDHYYIPCGKPNVMGVPIAKGSRGGTRPCGAMWGAFGGVQIPGQTQRAYCSKCWVAHCLNQNKDLEYAYERLSIGPKKQQKS